MLDGADVQQVEEVVKIRFEVEAEIDEIDFGPYLELVLYLSVKALVKD